MTFLWPDMLLFLLAVPALAAGYVWLMRRKHRMAERYASLTLVQDAVARSRYRRHIPPALFLAGLTIMIVSLARPMATVTLPSERATIILAMDVSGSMQATDIDPNRITAAQTSAKAFVLAQPPSTKVGVVAFAATAFLVQTPTLDREETIKAIDRFRTQYGTAVGSGIMVALQTIFPDIQFDGMGFGEPLGRHGGPLAAGQFGGAALGQAPKDQPLFQPVPPGSYKSAVIVLLSDGRTTMGPDPIEAGRVAEQRGVRVFTVGFGTADGSIVRFGGRSMFMQLDEETLKQIATMTGAAYFHAGNETDLKKIYQAIATQLVLEKQKTEITSFFPAVASIALVLSVLLSLLWFNRIA